MTTVNDGKDLVLQWTGHAAYVTERFSELLARQALVDVTLICQGQKLRVHKLVLATSSLYFEEILEQDLRQEPIILLSDLDFDVLKAMVEFMYCGETKQRIFTSSALPQKILSSEILEQDLGQEPIILLRDLDFDVLKAMVEFMYCGETTISQCHLQTLLEAARVFKVKELKCIIESMIKPKQARESFLSNSDEQSLIIDAGDISRKHHKGIPSVDNSDVKKISPSNFEDDEIPKNNDVGKLDDNSRVNYPDDDKSLYETTEKIENELSHRNKTPEESSDESSLDKPVDPSLKVSSSENNHDGNSESTKNDEISRKIQENSLNSFCNETHCCRLIDDSELRENDFENDSPKNLGDNGDDPPRAVGECSRVYTHKKRKHIDNDECHEGTMELAKKVSKFDENLEENVGNPKKLVKSLKVYTHKRRGSMDEKNHQGSSKVRQRAADETRGASSIDLSEDKTCDDASPSSDLDMETSEYIWGLSAKNIEYVVGCAIDPPRVAAVDSEETKSENQDGGEADDVAKTSGRTEEEERTFPGDDEESDETSETPILRRSVRINQLENDDSFNNNNDATNASKEREKSMDRDKNDCENGVTMNSAKSRRRTNKDVDNYRAIDENNVESRTNSRRSLRSRAKLGRSNISRNSASRDERTKMTRQSREKTMKIVSSDILVNTRLNTIASVDRALWGDMSDVLENREEDSLENFGSHSTSREIPFAVGLLPLRAALERMQATLDHQPRKTRSSVAPWRQDTTLGRKKCANIDEDHSTSAKKQANFHEDNVETAVCHIEIRTSSGPDVVDDPRVPADERIIAVGRNAKIHEQ